MSNSDNEGAPSEKRKPGRPKGRKGRTPEEKSADEARKAEKRRLRTETLPKDVLRELEFQRHWEEKEVGGYRDFAAIAHEIVTAELRCKNILRIPSVKIHNENSVKASLSRFFKALFKNDPRWEMHHEKTRPGRRIEGHKVISDGSGGNERNICSPSLALALAAAYLDRAYRDSWGGTSPALQKARDSVFSAVKRMLFIEKD